MNHHNIEVRFETDGKDWLELKEYTKEIFVNGEKFEGKVFSTGAIDALFDCKYGKLPYRSLRFEWETENKKSFQNAPVVAYPQDKDYTRITEYTKLPVQDVGNKTVFAVEYPLHYTAGEGNEPYYPVLTEEANTMYEKYKEFSENYPNLVICGRLGDFKYYNMDQALDKILSLLKDY